jgi:SnoaL-like domain
MQPLLVPAIHMLNESVDQCRRLADRAAIHDLHAAYFRGLDRGDEDQVRRCFTDDIVACYDGRSLGRPRSGEPIVGIEALMESFVTFRNQRTGAWKVTTHFMGNLNHLELNGDSARTETNIIACLVLTDGAERVLMRALRYIDRLRRTSDGWKICERVHTLDWSCEVPAIFAASMSERR